MKFEIGDQCIVLEPTLKYYHWCGIVTDVNEKFDTAKVLFLEGDEIWFETKALGKR